MNPHPDRHTPPGTLLLCISGFTATKAHPELVKDRVYTLKRMVDFSRSGLDCHKWEVQLVGLEHGLVRNRECGHSASMFTIMSHADGRDYQAENDCDLQGVWPRSLTIFPQEPDFDYAEAARRDMEKAKLFVAQFRRET